MKEEEGNAVYKKGSSCKWSARIRGQLSGAGPGSTGAEEGAAVIGWGEVDDVIVARGRADLGKGRGAGERWAGR